MKAPLPNLVGVQGCTYNNGKHQIVWIDASQKLFPLINTVVHESVHVWQHVIEYIEEAEHVGKEVPAYSIGNITEMLLKECFKQIGDERNALHEGRKT